jgi:hypothetical protein
MINNAERALLGGTCSARGFISKFEPDGPGYPVCRCSGRSEPVPIQQYLGLEAYRIDLGFARKATSSSRATGKLPGLALSLRRNPGLFHLSIGISYPDTADIDYANSRY